MECQPVELHPVELQPVELQPVELQPEPRRCHAGDNISKAGIVGQEGIPTTDPALTLRALHPD